MIGVRNDPRNAIEQMWETHPGLTCQTLHSGMFREWFLGLTLRVNPPTPNCPDFSQVSAILPYDPP